MKVSEGKSWKDTLLEVLPQRKFKMPNYPHNKKDSADNESTKGDIPDDEQKLTDVTVESADDDNKKDGADNDSTKGDIPDGEQKLADVTVESTDDVPKSE